MIKNRNMIAILAGFLLLSCNSGISGQTDQQQHLNHTWVLVSLSGELIQIDHEKLDNETPNMEINTLEMKYTGSDGCNHFTGGIMEVDDEHLKFGITAGTRKMCMEMEIPDQFNECLTQVSTYKIKKQALHLFNPEGELLMKLEKAN